jgi:hypothetical protein
MILVETTTLVSTNPHVWWETRPHGLLTLEHEHTDNTTEKLWPADVVTNGDARDLATMRDCGSRTHQQHLKQTSLL